jgi:hypothetical protein
MSRKFGPTRGELLFRFWAGVAGVFLLAGVMMKMGIPSGPALVELYGFGGLFFGGTAIWAGWKLWHRDHP